jgi:hypothetical protein
MIRRGGRRKVLLNRGQERVRMRRLMVWESSVVFSLAMHCYFVWVWDTWRNRPAFIVFMGFGMRCLSC